MAKLTGAIAKDVDAHGLPEDFSVMPDGRYVATLTGVTPQPKKPNADFGSWEWAYEINWNADESTEEDSYNGRKIREWLSLSDKDYPRQQFKERFHAFGVPATTDTDDLLGSQVILVIGHSIPQQGKLMGKVVNDILRVLPVDVEDDGEEPL